MTGPARSPAGKNGFFVWEDGAAWFWEGAGAALGIGSCWGSGSGRPCTSGGWSRVGGRYLAGGCALECQC